MNTTYQLQNFESWVRRRFEIYNSIFIGLSKTEEGVLLDHFGEHVKQGILRGETPEGIIASFCTNMGFIQSEEETLSLLVGFIGVIERQVVIFDAVEDSAFDKINDLHGSNSLNIVLKNYLKSGLADDLLSTIKDLKIRLVLTAHPTQFYSGAILSIINSLDEAIKSNDIDTINTLLQQLAYTPFYNIKKPTPLDEAQSLIWYLENALYNAVMSIHDELFYIMPSEGYINHNLVELGFWPGGDRDGNPFVTAEITEKVAELLRKSILRKYYRSIRQLKKHMTFGGVSDELLAIEKMLSDCIYGQGSIKKEWLIEKLEDLDRQVVEKFGGLYSANMHRLINTIKIFGTHFASVDIRQDAFTHRRVFTEMVPAFANAFETKTEQELVDWFTGLDASLTDLSPLSDMARETALSVKVIKTIQEQNGEKGCNRYIISNCGRASDVMLLYRLFTINGWAEKDITVDLIPLFETIDDLVVCDKVMETLYSNPTYMAHLGRRGNCQTIMLGFSDGTKDGGYFAANWSIYHAKEMLSAISEKYGIQVIFFDGRGGPAARGGGKTNQYYSSQAKNVANKEIQLTIQGQTISSNFGTPMAAQYNMEQLLSAALKNRVDTSYSAEFEAKDRQVMNEIMDISRAVYSKLKLRPEFIPYMQKYSPLNFFGKANIGSRPDKRNQGGEVKFESLRAIPFVGSWSQNKQNVPGYYGFGEALRQVYAKYGEADMAGLYQRSRFFRTLVENSQMVLEKSNFEVTAFAQSDEAYADIWSDIRQEYNLSIEYLLKVSGSKVLMEKNPKDKLSVQLRESIIQPLVLIQQFALREVDKSLAEGLTERAEIYGALVVRCSFGLINAGRNSA
ncbi:phosphoenolpyruvate carboxylase [Williamwhitmania taraxaci]|uniref:Phosphoenolpyruvate carboxylase n=1 Tax=Williamwhitmania taraxaci TaxID=1640674 RepID=A0A1G6P9I5_9BACT|nr:phosphoenolpyruvate carboxylase [Williamwhitmania taraxaci]SDC76025.1 Phosphoenolpyruvate carboxylase, type 1 [Williamwhitmania taraxaci]